MSTKYKRLKHFSFKHTLMEHTFITYKQCHGDKINDNNSEPVFNNQYRLGWMLHSKLPLLLKALELDTNLFAFDKCH